MSNIDSTMIVHFPSLTVPCPAYIAEGEWGLSSLTGLTVLFGKNGSGKSILLRAIRDARPETTHYVVPERTGDIGFDPGYIQQQLDGEKRRGNSGRNFMADYRRQIVARVQAYFMARGSSRSTDSIPVPPDEIESLLTQLIPDFAIELRGANPPYQIKRAGDNSDISTVDQLSSGEVQLLTVGLDVLTIAAIWEIQGASTRLLLVDEPDAHIHPDLQARFADFLVQVARRFKLQVIVASHSTTLLAAIGQFAAEDASVIYLDRTQRSFTAKTFTAVLKEVAACLGGHALMGPLFGVPLLLVEGDDDYRIWSQVPRHHVVNMAVIPCNGDEIFSYQKTLEQIFSSLRSPTGAAGYALLDGDKGLPAASSGSPQAHIKYLKMQCHEAENLFMTEEVLALLGTNWAQAALKIVSESSIYGSKATKLAAAGTWDRRTEDLKDVINEISKILDPKGVHWTVRVGTCLGRARPNGEIESFLGQEVVDALWGS